MIRSIPIRRRHYHLAAVSARFVEPWRCGSVPETSHEIDADRNIDIRRDRLAKASAGRGLAESAARRARLPLSRWCQYFPSTAAGKGRRGQGDLCQEVTKTNIMSVSGEPKTNA
jgi:hypothetical protein